MQDWDLSKENYQPLKRGRTQLCKDETKAGQKEAVDSQRRYFLVQCADASRRLLLQLIMSILQEVLAGTRIQQERRSLSSLDKVCTLTSCFAWHCLPKAHEYAHRFIKWTQETFRAGGHQAELLPLLERCTR